MNLMHTIIDSLLLIPFIILVWAGVAVVIYNLVRDIIMDNFS